MNKNLSFYEIGSLSEEDLNYCKTVITSFLIDLVLLSDWFDQFSKLIETTDLNQRME